MPRGQRRPRGKSVHTATASAAQRPPQLKDLRDLKTSAAHTPPLLKSAHLKDVPSSKTSPFQRRPQHLFWVGAKKKWGAQRQGAAATSHPKFRPSGTILLLFWCPRLLRRSKFQLFAQRLQARAKRCKTPPKHHFPTNRPINIMFETS